jgi:hypothetical protein
MFQFCFNDCIPKDGTNDGLVSHLAVTLTHYDTIKRKFSTSIDGIITDRYPSDLILNNSQFSLANCISQLSRELKKIALSNFNKYPVDTYYVLADIDNLLEREYSIEINATPLDALNAKIVEENGGVLFTLPIHDDLKKNRLTIADKEKLTVEVLNQYGADTNSEFVSDYIQADIVKRLDGFAKLLALVGDCKYNDRIQRDFESLTYATQTILLKSIEHALERKAKTRFYPDDNFIKDVTPDKERVIKVFELRIFTPVAIRMYLYETPTRIYFGSIEGKPKKKVQDSDILNAMSIIKELIALEG